MVLYHASSSYYSMIARLALLAAGVPFESRRMDIHLAKEQLSDWYLKINPHMTVPALVDGHTTLIDSHDILRYAAERAGERWMDQQRDLLPSIDAVVSRHYDIPIERLTFGKAFLTIAPLRFIFPRILQKMIRKLEAERSTSLDPQAIDQKIKLNRERLAYFTQGNLLEKLNVEREHVRAYLQSLPAPEQMLFGDRLSSADIVTAVLLGRLKMIGEYGLVEQGNKLDQWFDRMQGRQPFKRADIWTHFQPWRIVLKY